MSGDKQPTDTKPNDLPAAEAFAILSNETRLEIVRVLLEADGMNHCSSWEKSASPLSYSELQEAAGVSDNGNFNYHLNELQPYLVSKSDGGYELTSAGKQLSQAALLVSGRLPESQSGSKSLCPFCGQPTELS